MAELNDYSGEFRPDLKWQDFSKEALERLFRSASILYTGIDGAWYALMREKYGDKVANELHWELWRRHTDLDVGLIRGPMNLGDGVAGVLKFLQLSPGGGGYVYVDAEWELKNENLGIMTVKRCGGINYYEKTNDAAGQQDACGMEGWGLQGVAQVFDPNIKVTCLKEPPKLPARQAKDEIACQWEFRREV